MTMKAYGIPYYTQEQEERIVDAILEHNRRAEYQAQLRRELNILIAQRNEVVYAPSNYLVLRSDDPNDAVGEEIRRVIVRVKWKVFGRGYVCIFSNPGGLRNHTIDFFDQKKFPIYLYQDLVQLIDKRSEEHTSELQSRFDLVCRLLLEKKKKTHTIKYIIKICL